MRRTFLIVGLAAACGVMRAEEDTNLFCRVFLFDMERFQGETNRIPRLSDESEMKAYLSQLGVKWPVGARVYEAQGEAVAKIVVLNTLENLQVCHEVLDMSCDIVHMVEIDYAVFEFRPEDIQKLANTSGVSCEGLTALRNQGRAKLVATAHALTKTGLEAVVKNCQEVLFPTEVDLEAITNEAGLAYGTAPACFEMREVGTILTCVPEVSADGTRINIMIDPQWVTLSGWEKFEAKVDSGKKVSTADFKQPVFNVSSIRTLIAMNSGETVLLGGGRHAASDSLLYHFLTAKLIKQSRPK